jgi:hypothetical protein
MSASPETRFSVIAEITRRMKTDKVHQFGDDPDESLSDLMNFCVGVRSGQQLFIVYNGPGPLSARYCGYWSALFLGCDEIFCVADTRMKTYDPEPDDPHALVPQSDEVRQEEFYRNHPEFYPGSLSDEWESGQREGIQEAIQICRYPFLGPATIATYEYVRTGSKIVWGKVWEHSDNTGAIDDYIKEGYRKRRQVQPEMTDLIGRIHADMAKEGFPPEERPYWTDRGVAKMVSSLEGVFCVQHLSQIPGLPDVTFSQGEEIDPDSL